MSQLGNVKTGARKIAETIKPAMIGLLFSFGAGAAYADSVESVTGQLDAYEVTYNEAGEEALTTAERITPGGTIEYHLSYVNNSDAPLSGFTINGRVPHSAYYLSNSAQVVGDAIFQARTTDIDWQAPPLIRMVQDEAGILRPETVPPQDYAEIRWQLTEPVAAGDEVEARYRVRINR